MSADCKNHGVEQCVKKLEYCQKAVSVNCEHPKHHPCQDKMQGLCKPSVQCENVVDKQTHKSCTAKSQDTSNHCSNKDKDHVHCAENANIPDHCPDKGHAHCAENVTIIDQCQDNGHAHCAENANIPDKGHVHIHCYDEANVLETHDQCPNNFHNHCSDKADTIEATGHCQIKDHNHVHHVVAHVGVTGHCKEADVNGDGDKCDVQIVSGHCHHEPCEDHQ